MVSERGEVTLSIQRGAGVTEFARFLTDLETAYVALLTLPTERSIRGWRRRGPLLFEFPEFALDISHAGDWTNLSQRMIYPSDQLEISRISIQSPGWVELVGSLNPLQQLREYLKDRHERKKDRDWRGRAEKERAQFENDILRSQAMRERVGVIRECYELLESSGASREECQRYVWDKVGPPLMRLADHQDAGLLGGQDDQ